MKFFLFDSNIATKDVIETSIIDKGFYKSSDWISFESEDNYLITFEYDIEVEGYCDGDAGDYWTPPYSETIITNFDLTIKRCYYMDINDNQIDLEINNNSLKELISIINFYY